jgi:hypothetical protein
MTPVQTKMQIARDALLRAETELKTAEKWLREAGQPATAGLYVQPARDHVGAAVAVCERFTGER